MVVPVSGCADQTGPAVLPEDPLCAVFPADQIAPMIAPGEYTHNEEGERYRTIWYVPEYVYLEGGCSISSGQDGYFSVILTTATSFTEGSQPYGFAGPQCDDVPIDLVAPSMGQIINSGGCVEKESRTFYSAWVLYWGGRYIDYWPPITRINVSVIPRKGRDGVADATQVIQMLLDLVDRSYRADPSAASTQTVAPGVTPVPSPSPSATESGG